MPEFSFELDLQLIGWWLSQKFACAIANLKNQILLITT